MVRCHWERALLRSSSFFQWLLSYAASISQAFASLRRLSQMARGRVFTQRSVVLPERGSSKLDGSFDSPAGSVLLEAF